MIKSSLFLKLKILEVLKGKEEIFKNQEAGFQGEASYY
jgi:hypothetical protein